MAQNFDFDFKDINALKAALSKGAANAPKATAGVLYAEAQNMMREAKEQIPFRTGTAKGSGRVFPPNITGNSVTVDLGFGGAASDYVEELHQNERGAAFNNGKKDHYLEDPVRMLSGGLDDRILSAIKGFM